MAQFRIQLEVGRKNRSGTYGRGLYVDFEVDGGVALDDLSAQAESIAKGACDARGEEYVEVMIREISSIQPAEVAPA